MHRVVANRAVSCLAMLGLFLSLGCATQTVDIEQERAAL